MKQKHNENHRWNSLRAEAEQKIGVSPPPENSGLDSLPLLHELQVHQIELEMQNEELRLAQVSLEESRDRYLLLYNFAPIGYLTLSTEGMIVEANLTCTKLLGYDRNHLINRRFSQFVDMQSRDRWHQFLKFAIQKQLKQECELPLRRADGSVVEILLSSLLINVVGSTTMLNIALADISERKQSEQNEQKLNRQIKQYADRLNLLSRHHVAAQEEIRHRLSSELHSRTSSNLAAINNNLDIISTNIVRGESIELLNYLDDIRALLTDTTISIREISADLQPPALSYAGLVAAVESYRQLFEKRTGITVLLNFDNQDARFPRQLENLLFRIVQEALTNCAKHAQATQVKITLKNASFPLLLTIADNGIGFDLEALGKEVIAGLGLLNMREMVEIAGGTLNIISTANQGTRICVEILNGGE